MMGNNTSQSNLIAITPSTKKETKIYDLIPEAGIVKVQIISLKDDRYIKHAKFLGTRHFLNKKEYFQP
jgi:hypothetical protein